MGLTGILPDAFLRRMSPSDRRRMGKAGLTAAEATERQTAKREVELQAQVAAMLRQRDIVYNWSRMDRRKTDRTGWPDFTFAVPRKEGPGVPVAVEVKLPGRWPTEEQAQVIVAMRACGWRVEVIRSLAEFLDLLRELQASPARYGAEPAPGQG